MYQIKKAQVLDFKTNSVVVSQKRHRSAILVVRLKKGDVIEIDLFDRITVRFPGAGISGDEAWQVVAETAPKGGVDIRINEISRGVSLSTDVLDAWCERIKHALKTAQKIKNDIKRKKVLSSNAGK